MMHQSFLLSDVNRVHIDILIVLHKMHVIVCSDEELLLLRCIHVASIVLLLLDLHVSIFVLTVRKCMVQALSVIPGLLCTLLTARTLRPWRMWKLEVINVLPLCICIGWNCLHLYATAIHTSILCSRHLVLTIYFDVQSTGLVLVE